MVDPQAILALLSTDELRSKWLTHVIRSYRWHAMYLPKGDTFKALATVLRDKNIYPLVAHRLRDIHAELNLKLRPHRMDVRTVAVKQPRRVSVKRQPSKPAKDGAVTNKSIVENTSSTSPLTSATVYYQGHSRSSNPTNAPERREFARVNGYLPVNPYAMRVSDVTSVRRGVAIRTLLPPFTTKPEWAIDVGTFGILEGGHFDTSAVEQEYWLRDDIWSELDARVAAGLNNQVREQFIGGGETLAEGSKTLRMFSSAAKSLAGAARALKKGDISGFMGFISKSNFRGSPWLSKKRKVRSDTHLSGFASRWLEYRYGWFPIYMTVLGAMQLFARYQSKVRFCAAKAYIDSRITVVRPSAAMVPTIHLWEQQPADIRLDYTVKSTVRGTYIYSIDEGAKSGISRLMNELGLLDPFKLCYELIPLSFVLDWVVNAGDVINQMTAFVGKTYLSGSWTRSLEVVANITTPRNTNLTLSTSPLQLTPAMVEVKTLDVRRSVQPAPVHFGLQLQLNLNGRRLIDAAALIRVFSK